MTQPLHFKTVVCLGSGPSLTPADVATVKHWRETTEGTGVIACNASFKLAPWADVIYGCDAKFWHTYRDQLPEGPLHVSHAQNANVYLHNGFSVTNSGANAIALACDWGALKVLLLGYDCQVGAQGKTHFFGNHPHPLGNCANLSIWHGRFQKVADRYKTREIINCSRTTRS